MILSFRHNFLFVRARKVAGTSVEIALSTLCGPEDISPPIVAIDERLRLDRGGHCGNYSDDPLFEQGWRAMVRAATPAQLAALPPPPSRYRPHMTVPEIEAAYGAPLDAFRLICVERDPFAKVISFLHMREHFGGYRAGARDMAAPVDLAMALDRAIERDSLDILKSRDMYGGRTPEVIHYERLESDLAAFVATLGVPVPPLPHAKRGPLSNAIDPAAVFRRDQLHWLNVFFAEERAAFGYPPR